MAVEVYTLHNADGEMIGAILVDSVTGVPLPLSIETFECEEEADAFVEFCREEARTIGDPRKLPEAALIGAVEEFRLGWRHS